MGYFNEIQVYDGQTQPGLSTLPGFIQGWVFFITKEVQALTKQASV